LEKPQQHLDALELQLWDLSLAVFKKSFAQLLYKKDSFFYSRLQGQKPFTANTSFLSEQRKADKGAFLTQQMRVRNHFPARWERG
jgi:hypothetical protein